MVSGWVGWLVRGLIGWLVGWLVCCLVGMLAGLGWVGRLDGWFVGGWLSRLIDGLVVR